VPLRYLRQKNKGPAAARNFGVRKSHGDVIWFIGDDIFVTPQAVGIHFDIHNRISPGQCLAVLGPVTWHPDLEVTPFMHWWEKYRFKYPAKDIGHIPFWQFYTCNVSLPRQILLECGGFDEDFPYAAYEDTELAYRLNRKGMHILYASDALSYHYHPTDLASASKQIEALGASYEMYVRKTGDRGLPLAWLLLSRAPWMIPCIMRPIQRLADQLQWCVSAGLVYRMVLVYHFLVGRRLRPPLPFVAKEKSFPKMPPEHLEAHD
jgi:GT2 family glycosyltransferase